MLLLQLILCVCILFKANYFCLTKVNSIQNQSIFLSQNRIKRIVNGVDANERTAPYYVKIIRWLSLGEVDGFLTYAICGGNLISQNFVLTARHCVEKPLRALSVRLGGPIFHNSEQNSPLIQMLISEVIKFGPDTDTNNIYHHDIALIKLPQPVELNEFIQTVPLPKRVDSQRTYDYETGTVCGTGFLKSTFFGRNQSTSPILRCTNVTVCKLDCLMAGIVFPSWVLCIKGWSFNMGQTSSGDSGGGLVIRGTLVGIVLGAVTHLMPTGPFKYSKIGYYLDWIGNHTDIEME